jgi:hypothetical protein
MTPRYDVDARPALEQNSNMRRDGYVPDAPRRLADWPLPIVVFRCRKCDREGRYQLETLIEQFGPDVNMIELRGLVANCPLFEDQRNPCKVHYPQLSKIEE